MDIFMKCSDYTAADRVREAGLYPYFIPLTNNEGTEALIGDHHLIMIGSNNYLGLTVHPKVRQAAMEQCPHMYSLRMRFLKRHLSCT